MTRSLLYAGLLPYAHMNTRPPAAPSQFIAPVTDPDNESRSLVLPVIIVVLLGLLLLGVIVTGVIVSRESESSLDDIVTVAQLRADPDQYDNHEVRLSGQIESVRQLPYLDQYAIYTFRDDTGSMLALTRKGIPPDELRDDVRLMAVYHSRVTLDDELKSIVEDQLGPIAGQIVSLLLPGVPLNVVFLEHEAYELPSQ